MEVTAPGPPGRPAGDLAADPPPIRVEALCRSYRRGRIRAVHDVSFEVGRGEVFGLIGPEGPVGIFGTVLSGTGSLLGLAGIVTGAVDPKTGAQPLDRRGQSIVALPQVPGRIRRHKVVLDCQHVCDSLKRLLFGPLLRRYVSTLLTERI